jgi:nucleotide-binding universal stress UspA family protein
MSPNRLLWPTDFSEDDRDALLAAGEMARLWEAELIALHVIADVAEQVYEEKTTEGRDQAAWALWKIGKEKAEKRLADVVSKALPGFDRYRCLVAFGDPAKRITDVVRAELVGLVVMSARHDKSLLQEMLLGSVAYKVVRTVPCNIMLVK